MDLELPDWLSEHLDDLGAELGPEYTIERLKVLVSAAATGNAITVIQAMNPYEIARATFDIAVMMPLAMPIWIALLIRARKRVPEPGTMAWQDAAARGMIPPQLVYHLIEQAMAPLPARRDIQGAVARAAARGRGAPPSSSPLVPILIGVGGLALVGGLVGIAVVASRSRS